MAKRTPGHPRHDVSSAETIPHRPPANFTAEYAARSRSTHSILAQSARASRLTSIVAPYLRRPSVSETPDMSTPKTPLLSLKLSSLSFLDSSIYDDQTRHPLYAIKTTGTSTAIKRSDPWGGASQKVAVIKWPKMIPYKTKDRQSLGVLLQMKGDNWREGDNFLKQSSMSSGHKFSIPQYSHTLKWKKVGSSYWCTAPSCKGPIAILEPHVASVPPRLRIYETFHDKYNNGSLAVHSGVSILLMDYLLVTALLLVTDIQEWMVVQKYDGDGESSRNDLHHQNGSSTSGDDRFPLSVSSPRPVNIAPSRWRKILNGEPLFPKLNLQRTPSTSTTATGYAPTTPTSVQQLAKIIHGEPMYPNIRTPSLDSMLSLSDDEDRVPSPIASSIYFPPTGAPSHDYFDPTFYDTSDAPPVPPLPAKYASPSRHDRAESSSVYSQSSPRSLPTPPQSSPSPLPSISQPWVRSQSTPPEEVALDPRARAQTGRPSTSSGISSSLSPQPIAMSRTSRSSSMTRSSMMSNGGFPRKLPDLPTQTPTPPPSTSPASRSSTLPPPPTTPTRSVKRTSAVPRSLPPTPVQRNAPLPEAPIQSQQVRQGRTLRSVSSSSASLASSYVSEDVEATPRASRVRTRLRDQDKDSIERVHRGRPPTIRESVFDREVPPPAYSSLDHVA
ncbi:hypothetical protein PC9H_007276 [Pleurotus ostreatus]|uniref:Uncharacterized protein n=1 Tax=Pleurotus ostreatus TaxID=5322 RepID=A0A8H7DRD7_PLEOS|nr:uncharacterized protein PC9H_007276 [Pleurotus ostreatus]KAF7428057.1 hypothetical protein PC9H_007276 [Pleurotus ostreatus]KAJ8696109.1 hypothetical protein PTI98_006002 [Pleurotus ostreatus]